jgi:hypothetical protein
MGLLWRLLAPKPLKKVRRSVRKVAHPVRAIAPRPIKKIQHTARTVANPLEAAEFAAQNTIIKTVKRK